MSDRMERNLFKYIWTHSKRQQVWILIVVALSMPTYFLAFDIPKLIVNGPIQGRGFETPTRRRKCCRSRSAIRSASRRFTLFSGFELDRMGALIALSMAFLGYVIINGMFKLYINTYKGRLGERMLRRLRYQLVDRVLRFPMAQYRRVRSSEIATMIKDEVDPLGGFIGEAFATPAFLVGQALAALLFIMLQSWMLGPGHAGDPDRPDRAYSQAARPPAQAGAAASADGARPVRPRQRDRRRRQRHQAERQHQFRALGHFRPAGAGSSSSASTSTSGSSW